MKKRILAFLLAATMLLSFVPQAVLAAPDEETPATEPAAVESEIAAPVETPAAPAAEQPGATQESVVREPTQESGQETPAPEETSAQDDTQDIEAQPSETTEAAPQETIPAQTEALTVRMFGAPVAVCARRVRHGAFERRSREGESRHGHDEVGRQERLFLLG